MKNVSMCITIGIILKPFKLKEMPKVTPLFQ